MYAIRQIQKVQGRTVTVELPPDFPADRVEIIVLPAEPTEVEDLLEPAVQAFLKLDTSGFTEEQRAAYERVKEHIRRGRAPDEPRILGLFEGIVTVADDFDAPLPSEIEDLFWGSETDEYGILLNRP